MNNHPGKFGPVSALVITFAAFILSQVAAGVLLFGGYSLIKQKNSDQLISQFSNSTLGQFMFIVLAQIAVVGIIYWFMRFRKISFAEIGLGRAPKLNDLGHAVIYGIGYFILTVIILGLVDKFIPAVNVNQEQQLGFESATGPFALALVFLCLVVFVPIAEEIMVRGFLYSGLRRKLTRFSAALVASILFGIAHLQLGTGAPPLYVVAIDTFVLSMVLIALREKTGSLWSGIIVHAFKNGVAFLALFIFNFS